MTREDSDAIAVVAGDDVVEDNWTVIEDGELKGMKCNNGVFHSLSSESTCDIDRWRVMPSLEGHRSLIKLDLYKHRYIKKLHDSVCSLIHLKVLSLVRCEKLNCLPEKIGDLKNLQELNLTDASELSFLPESLGDLSSLRKLSVGGHQGSGNKLLKTLPSTLGRLSNLETLCLDKCKELESLPPDIGKLRNLKVLLMR